MRVITAAAGQRSVCEPQEYFSTECHFPRRLASRCPRAVNRVVSTEPIQKGGIQAGLGIRRTSQDVITFGRCPDYSLMDLGQFQLTTLEKLMVDTPCNAYTGR